MERSNLPAPARGSGDAAGADAVGADAVGADAVGAGAAGADAAIRDADEILARAALDERAADEARERYRTQPMAALEADAAIAPLLAPGEVVVATRRSVVFDRRQAAPGSAGSASLGGDLYLTSRRLVLVGRRTVWFDLDEIAETLLAGDQLLLVMQDGRGASLGVLQPRLLRVEIAAARASARPETDA